MSYTKGVCRKALSDALRGVCDKVTDAVALPEVEADKNNDFPYLCLIDDQQNYGENQRQCADYRLIVLGFVKGDENDLQDKLDTLENKTFFAITQAQKIKAHVAAINNRNVYAPWGLNAGVFYPFAAFRMDIVIPFVQREEDEMVDWAAFDARYVKRVGDNMLGPLGFGTAAKWTMDASGDNLVFYYNGVAKLRYDPVTGKFETIMQVQAEGGFDETTPFVP